MSTLTAILPCNDMQASYDFYQRLGFSMFARHDGYWILTDSNGAGLHLTGAVPGWLRPGKNPFGLYFYADDVDALAAEFAGEILGCGRAEDKPWKMYEFAMSDPDHTLVRIGRLSGTVAGGGLPVYDRMQR
jgi:catechol 2,3-dioxygenase-like lactoylglutathione lyase family enzyme